MITEFKIFENKYSLKEYAVIKDEDKNIIYIAQIIDYSKPIDNTAGIFELYDIHYKLKMLYLLFLDDNVLTKVNDFIISRNRLYLDVNIIYESESFEDCVEFLKKIHIEKDMEKYNL